MDPYQEHCDFNYSTDAEIDQASANAEGAKNEDQPWILSNRDVWYANPYYTGPEVPHPEDYCYEDEDDGQPDEAQEWADFDPDC